MHSFFPSQAPTHHRITFHSRVLYMLNHKFHFSKAVYVIFHFLFRLVFINVDIFVQQKPWALWV